MIPTCSGNQINAFNDPKRQNTFIISEQIELDQKNFADLNKKHGDLWLDRKALKYIFLISLCLNQNFNFNFK